MNKDRRARQKARKLLAVETPERRDVTVTAGTASASGVVPQPPDTPEQPLVYGRDWDYQPAVVPRPPD